MIFLLLMFITIFLERNLLVMRALLYRISNLSIPLKIIFSFILVILAGSFLLTLPISQTHGSEATYFDHLFTAVSMFCVTGLYSHPFYATYSQFGMCVNILLIQIGGLGIMTLVATIFMQLGRRVSIRDEFTISESLNRDQLSDFQQFIRKVVK